MQNRRFALVGLAGALLVLMLSDQVLPGAGSAALAAIHARPTPSLTPAPQAQSHTIFAVIGDFGTDDADEAAVARLVAGWKPDFILSTGDNFYRKALDAGDSGNKYHESVGKYYCDYLAGLAGADNCPAGSAKVNRFFPVVGNHDYTDATPALETYTRYFTLPGKGIQSSHTSGNERYYDFVQGPVHFFVLNSNSQEPDRISSSGAQARWLRAQLAASKAPWQVVLFHHPPYASDAEHGSKTAMQWPFAEWGADAVLTGHAHAYERIMRDGIVYFVNGLGGAPRYAFAKPVEGSAFRYNARPGAQRVIATDTALIFEFVSIDGVIQESYRLAASRGPAAPAQLPILPVGKHP